LMLTGIRVRLGPRRKLLNQNHTIGLMAVKY